jgi:hypothetical protein
MTDADDASMRASDADREAVAERLRHAVTEGRLDLAEYDERLQAAYAAVTLGDLSPLTRDLPEPVVEARSAEVAKKEKDQAKLHKELRDWAGTSFLLVGIWLVTSIGSGAFYFFWPAIPMGIWAVVIVAGVLFGDDADAGGRDSRS